MLRSDTIGHLAEALAKVQGELPTVTKDKTAKIPTKSGGSYSYKYADLESVVSAVRKPLADAGLSVAQFPEWDDKGDGAVLTTIVMHSSGEWLQSSIPLMLTLDGPQAQGSAITYGRRYALCAALGVVADEDDDASGAEQQRQPPQVSRGTPTPEGSHPRQGPVADQGTGEIVGDEEMEARRQRIIAEARARGPLQEQAEKVQAIQQRTRRSPMRPMA